MADSGVNIELASADAKVSTSESVRLAGATPWIDRHPRLTFLLVLFIRWFRLLTAYAVVFLSYCDLILKVSKATGVENTRDMQTVWRQLHPNATISSVDWLYGYCDLLYLAAYSEADWEKLEHWFHEHDQIDASEWRAQNPGAVIYALQDDGITWYPCGDNWEKHGDSAWSWPTNFSVVCVLLLTAAITRALHLWGSLRAYRELRETAKLRYFDVAVSLIYNKNFVRWRWKARCSLYVSLPTATAVLMAISFHGDGERFLEVVQDEWIVLLLLWLAFADAMEHAGTEAAKLTLADFDALDAASAADGTHPVAHPLRSALCCTTSEVITDHLSRLALAHRRYEGAPSGFLPQLPAPAPASPGPSGFLPPPTPAGRSASEKLPTVAAPPRQMRGTL